MSKRQAGFSLIELLIVVAIILVIAAIANALADLGDGGSSNCVASTTQACLIDSLLASGVKSGYSITYANDGNTPSVGYTVHADPVVRGQTGRRSFFSNQPGEIRYNLTAVATLTDPAI